MDGVQEDRRARRVDGDEEEVIGEAPPAGREGQERVREAEEEAPDGKNLHRTHTPHELVAGRGGDGAHEVGAGIDQAEPSFRDAVASHHRLERKDDEVGAETDRHRQENAAAKPPAVAKRTPELTEGIEEGSLRARGGQRGFAEGERGSEREERDWDLHEVGEARLPRVEPAPQRAARRTAHLTCGALQALRAGVRVGSSRRCERPIEEGAVGARREGETYAEEELFYSYRRTTHRGEADYGRQISAIVLED